MPGEKHRDGSIVDGNIYLNVRYEERDRAKALGCRWNPARKQWYIQFSKVESIPSAWMGVSPNPTPDAVKKKKAEQRRKRIIKANRQACRV